MKCIPGIRDGWQKSYVISLRFLFAICVFAVASPALKAQYIGDQAIGIAGLQAGSEPLPGIYITLPAYLRESGLGIYGPQGIQAAKNATADVNLIVLPAIEIVTPFKILGATYGAAFTEWITNGTLTLAALNATRSTKYGYGDIYVQPVILGWHKPHADFTAGYAFFAPTGAGSAGQHMWINELDLGLTVRPDPARKWNISTMMYYDFSQKKRNTDVRVGNIATLVGGLGHAMFLKGLGDLGVAYGAQWKMTHDNGSGIPPFLSVTDGRAFGVGPEVDVPVFLKGQNLALVSFRYLWPIDARTALSGQVMMVSFTFAHLRGQ